MKGRAPIHSRDSESTANLDGINESYLPQDLSQEDDHRTSAAALPWLSDYWRLLRSWGSRVSS